MTTASVDQVDTTWTATARFLQALTARDFDAMSECLHPEAWMRALVPKGPRVLMGRDEVVAQFVQWFSGEDSFEVVDASIGRMGSRAYMRWRVRMCDVQDPTQAREAEQHAFVGTGEQVESLDLLCSGWQQEGKGN